MNSGMMLAVITRFLKEIVTVDNGLIAGLLLLFGAVQIVTRL
jgi:hypothetical protein